MSFGEIKKINSDMCKPLDTLIKEKMGTVNDTGGTATSGGIFAKLNKLLTDWTTTRAGKIDNIDTTVSSRASQTSITTLQNTINTINGNVVAPAITMKNPRIIYLGTSINKSEFTINLPLNVRIIRFLSEYNNNIYYRGGIENGSAIQSCVINGVSIPIWFHAAINSPDSSSAFGVVDKIFTSSTSFPFKGPYSTQIPYNVYVLVCDI